MTIEPDSSPTQDDPVKRSGRSAGRFLLVIGTLLALLAVAAIVGAFGVTGLVRRMLLFLPPLEMRGLE